METYTSGMELNGLVLARLLDLLVQQALLDLLVQQVQTRLLLDLLELQDLLALQVHKVSHFHFEVLMAQRLLTTLMMWLHTMVLLIFVYLITSLIINQIH